MKKTLFIIIINLFFLIAFLVCQAVSAAIATPLNAGRAAPAWAGQSGERFTQLAAFFPPSYEFNDEAIYNVRKSVETSLLAVSLEGGDDRRLYADAWSAESSATVIGQRGSASASIIGVGGDFFLFHPLYLRNGSYISPNDIMRDRVVLDEELAWRLYGSVNLAGLEVVINNKPFHIAGVITRESGFAYDKAYDGGAGLYMSYEALSAMTGGAARISCYEIVMPDIVTNFAFDSLTSAFANDAIHIVDNTSRFSYSNLFSVIGSFGERSLRSDTVSYPYWENAVRYAEDWVALLLLISLIMMVCPTVFAVIYGTKLVRFGIKQLKNAVRALWKKREDRVYTRYMQKQDTL